MWSDELEYPAVLNLEMRRIDNPCESQQLPVSAGWLWVCEMLWRCGLSAETSVVQIFSQLCKNLIVTT